MKIDIMNDHLVVTVPEWEISKFKELLDNADIFYKDKADDDDSVIYAVDLEGLSTLQRHISIHGGK